MKRKLAFLFFLLLAATFIKAQPKASFIASPNKGCAPVTIKFINQSTGNGLTYFWDLGNGNTSILKEPKAIYYAPGLYTIKLKITDKSGKTDSITKTNFIEVFKNPVADFSGKTLNGCLPFDPILTDKSKRGTGMITEWIWDYGDGKIVSGSTPIYPYSSSGTFSVSLMVKDLNGCTSDTIKEKYITANETPQVAFIADKTFSCAKPFTVNFTNKTTGLKSGDKFEWNFGDGTKSTDKNPKKTYNDTGKFSVSLSIVSASKCNTNILIKNYIAVSKLKPSFTVEPSPVCESAPVSFTNTTKPDNVYYSGIWEFGDGETWKGSNMTHKYKKSGIYNVKLTVSLTDGSCKESTLVNNAVNVLANPKAKFGVKDSILCLKNLLGTFTDVSTGGDTRQWFLNDKYISAKKEANLIIKKTGYNKITLIVSNESCSDTIKNDKAIFADSIFPKFKLEPHSGCVPLKVNFADTTKKRLPTTIRLWELGNGSYKSDSTFDYTYTEPGMYIVKLNVSTGAGCKNYKLDTIYVSNKPEHNISFPSMVKCNSEIINYNLDGKNKGIDKYKWFVDGKLVSEENNLKYEIDLKPGKHNIKLVIGNKGCYDTIISNGSLGINPPYVSYKIKETKCTKYPYYFTNTSLEADTICWIFDDGSKVYNKNSIVVNNASEPWPVQLWGKNNKTGCTDTWSEITKRTIRYAGFTIYETKCELPANILINNTSKEYSSFYWDFGDGETRNTNNYVISRVYTEPGNYTIKMIATDKDGCKDTADKIITVSGTKADFEIFPKEGCGPHTITLINKTIDKSNKQIHWNITGVKAIPVIEDTMHYVFKKPGPLINGAYEVSLTITDAKGCTGIKKDTVKIGGYDFNFDILQFTTTCKFPKITIQPIFKQQVDVRALNCFWDLGDGRKPIGSVVDYFYNASGKYNVTLKVIDEAGCITEKDTFLVMKEKDLIAKFEADKLDANCPPLAVNFKSTSTSKLINIRKYEWDFGDGSYSKLANPSHVYLKAGKFTVKLRITDGYGCSDEIVYKDLVLINGPIGIFSFDKKEGCTPLKVSFNSTTQNTLKMEWDMGDGIILEDSANPVYHYSRVGNYIPLVILSDSFGCKYTLPPVDVIKVYPLPVAQFNYTAPCANMPVYFSNLSTPIKGKIKRCKWDFGDGDTSSKFEPSHIFKTRSTFNVKLKVWNTDDCMAELTRPLVMKNTTASFKPGKDGYCTGQIATLINTSRSDTEFKSYQWFLNDSLFSKNNNPILPLLTSGVYKISLVVEDKFGCIDTFIQKQGLIISDTIPPVPPFVYRVSVENDNSVVLDYSGCKSFDFKQYTIYSSNKKIAQVSNKIDTSIIINSLNTLHNVYCYKVTVTNLCGSESEVDMALEHCTIETTAKGELKRVNVAWNAYKGWPVNKYEVFREDMSEKGKYDYLATVDGKQLSYIDSHAVCKITHFYKIKAFENGGYNQISWSDTAAAIPIFKNSVPPNSTIRATVDFDKEITIEWTGSGFSKIPIREYILEKSEDGKHYKWYQSFKPDDFAFTDKKVLVDDKSYYYRTYAVDTCENTSPVTNFAKTILLKADTNVQERPFVTWSSYQGWTEGVNQYEVQRKQQDGTFTSIGFTSAYDSILVDNVTDLNGYPYYCYRVIGYRNISLGQKQIISVSNEDCAPVRSRIFAANAFTINGDNINETFDIKGLYIRDYNIKIFNRWGEKVFESNDMNEDWDGYYQGKLSQMDAYIWIIKAVGVDDVKWPMKGTVTLVR